MLHALHHELRNPFSPADLEILIRIGVHQQHLELSAVPAVDQTGRVEAGHTMLQRQTAAGLDEPGVPLRNSHGEPCGHQRAPTAGSEHGIVSGRKVEAGVTATRIAGEREVEVESHHRNLKHRGIVERP